VLCFSAVNPEEPAVETFDIPISLLEVEPRLDIPEMPELPPERVFVPPQVIVNPPFTQIYEQPQLPPLVPPPPFYVIPPESPPSVVPEPSTLILILSGIAAQFLLNRNRRL